MATLSPSDTSGASAGDIWDTRSEEHTSELQSQSNLVCRLLLEKKKNNHIRSAHSPLTNNAQMRTLALSRSNTPTCWVVSNVAWAYTSKAIVPTVMRVTGP